MRMPVCITAARGHQQSRMEGRRAASHRFFAWCLAAAAGAGIGMGAFAPAAVLAAPRADHGMRLCEHSRYKGWCLHRSDVEDLHRIGWGDRISSVGPAPRNVGIVLYRDAGCNPLGGERRFGSAVPDLAREGINDAASSVRVLRGKWMLCEHRRFRGRCRVIDAGRCVRDLRTLRLNDAVSSIRPIERWERAEEMERRFRESSEEWEIGIPWPDMGSFRRR